MSVDAQQMNTHTQTEMINGYKYLRREHPQTLRIKQVINKPWTLPEVDIHTTLISQIMEKHPKMQHIAMDKQDGPPKCYPALALGKV